MSENFKLDVDDVFTKVWLFKKKNYMGINEKGKFIIKGLPIIKHNASDLGKKMLPRLKEESLEKNHAQFDREYLKGIIDAEIGADITIIAQTYNVKDVASYKSLSSIQAQISNQFGEGIHMLVPNKRIGQVGKGKKYATLEEAKQLQESDLVLDKVWKELDPFIEYKDI